MNAPTHVCSQGRRKTVTESKTLASFGAVSPEIKRAPKWGSHQHLHQLESGADGGECSPDPTTTAALGLLSSPVLVRLKFRWP